MIFFPPPSGEDLFGGIRGHFLGLKKMKDFRATERLLHYSTVYSTVRNRISQEQIARKIAHCKS